jgi:hypothetical protein
MDNSVRVGRPQNVEKLMAEMRDLAHGKHTTGPFPEVANCLAIQQFHHEKRCSILIRIVVENAHGTGMRHGVGSVSFPKESAPYLVNLSQRGVKDLNGDTVPVSVSPLVDGRHATHTDKCIEAILAAEGPTDEAVGKCAIIDHYESL